MSKFPDTKPVEDMLKEQAVGATIGMILGTLGLAVLIWLT